MTQYTADAAQNSTGSRKGNFARATLSLAGLLVRSGGGPEAAGALAETVRIAQESGDTPALQLALVNPL